MRREARAHVRDGDVRRMEGRLLLAHRRTGVRHHDSSAWEVQASRHGRSTRLVSRVERAEQHIVGRHRHLRLACGQGARA